MPETPPTPLTDQTLKRLRKLATGNGLVPEAIALVGTDEQIYSFEGVMQFMPSCEAVRSRNPGGTQGKGRVMVPNFSALQMEADRLRQEFKDSTDWIPKVIDELKAEPGAGWGLNDAVVAVPNRSVILAATETCPTCQGRQMLTCQQCQGEGHVVCTQCQGRGRERCYHCLGSGQEPNQPDQACTVCNRSLEAPCRFCHTNGHLSCPTCQGRRGLACNGCNSTGRITEEITMTCGAKTNFRLVAEGLPSGMRRGFDRLGIENLAKGHADIEALPQEQDGDEDASPHDQPHTKKPPEPVLKYRATMPYADIRVRFGDGRVKLIGAFGKRCSLLNVPPFLDESLRPWREKLADAARGQSPIEPALEARAIRETLGLQISGKGQIKEIRRLYSIGLSPDVANEILTNLRRALNRFTLKHRSLMAVLGGALSAAAFGSVYMTPINHRITAGWTHGATWAFNIALLVALSLFSWFLLGSTARMALQKRFPDQTIPFQQETGKTGYAMLTGICLLWGLAIFLGSR